MYFIFMIIEIYGGQCTTLYKHILAASVFVKPYTPSFVCDKDNALSRTALPLRCPSLGSSMTESSEELGYLQRETYNTL